MSPIQRGKMPKKEPANRKEVRNLLGVVKKEGRRSKKHREAGQKAVDLVARDLIDQGVVPLTAFEMRRRLKTGRLVYKGSPQDGDHLTDAGRGLIYVPKGPDEDTQAQAFPPGWDGEHAKPAEVEVHSGAMLDDGFLYSKTLHELQHVGQYQKKEASQGEFIYGQKSGKTLTAAQEMEAYGTEILAAETTGLSARDEHLQQVYQRFLNNHAYVEKFKRHLNEAQQQKVDAIHREVTAKYQKLTKGA